MQKQRQMPHKEYQNYFTNHKGENGETYWEEEEFKWRGIKYWIAMHWKTHHWESKVTSQRADRTGVPRDGKSQDAPVDFTGEMNAQAMIDTMRKRLCCQASPETREYAEDFKRALRKVEPELSDVLAKFRTMKVSCRLLFLEALPETIIRRYKESRRPHPLAAPGMSIEDAIKHEKELLAPIRERADYIVDSSSLTLGKLQNRLYDIFASDGKKRGIDVTVMSFGYKYGLPMSADIVLDARFLPNPYYVDELRPMCGLDRPVRDYVFACQQTRDFMEQLEKMIDFLLPLYVEEGKLALTIAIGCTGGQHRSVALAAALNEHLSAQGVNSVNVNRDVDK